MVLEFPSLYVVFVQELSIHQLYGINKRISQIYPARLIKIMIT